MKNTNPKNSETRCPARRNGFLELCEGVHGLNLTIFGKITQTAITAVLLAVLPFTALAQGDKCSILFDNGSSLDLPVATTDSQKALGLSHRTSVSPGMVFAWNEPSIQIVWMKNTHIPLSAAWIGADGLVQSIQDMTPETEDRHSSLHPAVGVIELPQGGFQALGIRRGNTVVKSSCFPITKPS